jgi:hypothetical protein
MRGVESANEAGPWRSDGAVLNRLATFERINDLSSRDRTFAAQAVVTRRSASKTKRR